MEYINSKIKANLSGSSLIRKMFEAGIELKKKYGENAICDFSLGNPDLPPPAEVKKALQKITQESNTQFAIGYMPNAGYSDLRAMIAEKISDEQNCKTTGSEIMLGCGAAGCMNVLFHSILEFGDEVIVPTPYFVEYDAYVANHGGVLRRAPSQELTFDLDIEAFEKEFSPKTRAIIINSPNNPTGKIYSTEELEALATLVHKMEVKYDRVIYVISDEPYRFLNFDKLPLPSFFTLFDNAVIIGSFSKNLSLAGERLGYVAVSPRIKGKQELMAALIMCNRTLGFVNAPAIGQKILISALNSEVDLNVYRKRRDAMVKVLDRAGLQYARPQGAFYVFPKSPCKDENDFVNELLNEKILVVPGTGFGRPGYVRIAFCVDEKIIERSLNGFVSVVKKFC